MFNEPLILSSCALFRLPPAFVVWSFFHLVSAVCLLVRAAIFRLPPTFVVFFFSFFLFSFLFVTGICVQFLSYTAFYAVGIRARLSAFAFFLS